jgi:hypothetical protein
VVEKIPSAPTTRSKRRGAARSNVTSTPPAVSTSAVIVSSNRYSTPPVASIRTRIRSPRRISRSAMTPPESPNADMTLDSLFDFGLQRLLGGLESFVGRHR